MSDLYEKQIEILVDYFKKAEAEKTDFKLGIEIEHLILHKEDLKAVTFFEKKGIENILKTMLVNGNWEPVYENEYLVGLNGKQSYITLEPGGQFEISINPLAEVSKIQEIYYSFLEEIIPILEDYSYYLTAVGYQPESLINDIPLLPKERYRYMYKYFQEKGKFAYNMMKGTASIHISIDYHDEDDYIKKTTVANNLTPLIYSTFANTPFFEGEINDSDSIRSIIWDNCDRQRCHFNKFNQGYRAYAEFILNTPPILVKKDGQLVYTAEKPFKEILDPQDYTMEELRHILTMVFPPVRTKEYIELRMGDSLPYPFSLGYILFWKGILYNEENLNWLYNKFLHESNVNFDRDFFNLLLQRAREGVDIKERYFLDKIENLVRGGMSPAKIIINNLKQVQKKQALEFCILNNIL